MNHVGSKRACGHSVGRSLLALVVTPALLALAQHPYELWPLAGCALVPWLLVTQRSNQIGAILLGAAVGWIYGLLVAPWLPEALEQLRSSRLSALVGWGVTAFWAKVPVFAGLGWFVWRVQSVRALTQIATVAAAFAAADFLVSHWHFGVPWALLGHSQGSSLGVAQLAAVGGVPLISGLLGAVNLSLALSLDGTQGSGRYRRLASCVGAWIALSIFGLPLAKAVRSAPPEGVEQMELLLVQPALPRGARWDPKAQSAILEIVGHLSERALAAVASREPPDAIVWPENLVTTPLDQEPALTIALERQVDTLGVPILTGWVQSARSHDPRLYRGAVLWAAPSESHVEVVHKAIAVPVVEASGGLLGNAWLGRLFGESARWKKVEEAPLAGPVPPSFPLAPLLCYEALFPRAAAARRNSQTLALVNMADDSWVAGDSATRQLLAFSAFRAIEQRLTLVRVAHGGLSAIISPFGETLIELPLDEESFVSATVAATAPAGAIEKLSLCGLALLGAALGWLIVSAFDANRDSTSPL